MVLRVFRVCATLAIGRCRLLAVGRFSAMASALRDLVLHLLLRGSDPHFNRLIPDFHRPVPFSCSRNRVRPTPEQTLILLYR